MGAKLHVYKLNESNVPANIRQRYALSPSSEFEFRGILGQYAPTVCVISEHHDIVIAIITRSVADAAAVRYAIRHWGRLSTVDFACCFTVYEDDEASAMFAKCRRWHDEIRQLNASHLSLC
jgi:hypothetical protein